MGGASLLIIVALLGVVAIAVAIVIALGGRKSKLEREVATLQAERSRLEAWVGHLTQENASLSRFRHIVDAEREAQAMREAAAAQVSAAEQQANAAVATATAHAERVHLDARANSENMLGAAQQQASGIVAEANRRAHEIAAEALEAKASLESNRREAQALRNVIEGYGHQYVVPSSSVLDELAEAYGFDQAGENLKQARTRTREFVRRGHAAACDYVEANRRDTAVAFVIDAFNGKVDSVLARVKADNFGTLRQEILDAFALVNLNGRAFRQARITDEYLQARLDELRWATAVHELKNREREEQRIIKEQMREEEKARREYERAMKEASKEEETIRKAMEKAQKEIERAGEAQRAKYEALLQDLAVKLQAAEEKNQRAISMAQQTRTGHVYVISNIGSFGEEVFKIGLTRRLEPLDRIRELGDASVPFAFDVHALILSEDAPGLERALHKHFVAFQMNKVNPRKEFFRVGLPVIRQEIENLGIQASWTMAAAAAEYRESLAVDRARRDNPASYQDWMDKQLAREPTPFDDSDQSETPGPVAAAASA